MLKPRSLHIFVLIALFVSFFCGASSLTPVQAAGRCYVKSNAAGTNNGTSWTDAYISLQSAIADSCTEIWVTSGTYKPHTSDPTVSFALESGTAIYGGFAGAETALEERNITANPTTLSGDLNGNDDGVISFNNLTRSENSRHVVVSIGVIDTAILDGFTVTGGNASGADCPSPPNNCGGGMYIGNSYPTLSNLIFTGNTAVKGGGMFNNSFPSLTNIIFTNNYASYGGGMYNYYGGTPSLTNVTFSTNTANTGGGGMYNIQSNPSLTNVTFSANIAHDGGGMYNTSNSDPILKNVTFSANSAWYQGGGIFNTFGSRPALTNVTFSANSAVDQGGGMFISDSSPILKNVLIANSTSGGDCVISLLSALYGTSSNNLIEDGTNACGLSNGTNGNIIGSDPNLGPLANNGGATETFALQTNSLALNAGTNTGCPDADQRGVTRPQNVICDIGAYESTAQPGPTFVVNTNADTDDGFCDVFGQGIGNQDCTLREAINAGNANMDASTITFNDSYTITLVGSQLPVIDTEIIITGDGIDNTVIQANADPNTATYRVFQVDSSGDLTLNDLTIQNGRCNGSCVGIAGQGDEGGGIFNDGTLVINNSLIAANVATDWGAGVANNGGTVTITSSTFTTNSSYNAGGAVLNYNGLMNISNSTIANNTSTNNVAGGVANYGTLNIYNSTISGNTSNSGPYDGANIFQSSGALSLYNTIVANSTTDGDCGIFGGTVNATNTLIESTGSLACGLTDGVDGNIIGSDPNLGLLTGSPAYFPLNSGSPAIDAGDDTLCAASPVNNESQNGVTRPQGSHCDIGAFENMVMFNLFLPLILR